MQKKVGKNVPPMQSSDKAHTGGIRGGHPVAKHGVSKGVGLKRKVVKGKSLSSKKTKTRKRFPFGTMQKPARKSSMVASPSWKPFGM